MERERNYGIDLLRLVLMFMVCVLHVLGHGGVLSASRGDSVSFHAFCFLEICAYCAVDGFALISGYVSAGRAPRWDRIVNMWFQVFFYSFGLTAILCLTPLRAHIGIKELVQALFPVTSNYFWYFTSYFALFFAMPMLSGFVDRLEIHAARMALVLLIVLYAVIGFPADAFGLQGGYSAIWLMLLYCMGALTKKVALFSRRKTSALVIAFFILSALSWGLMAFFEKNWLINYASPTMLLCALILVVLFSRAGIRGTLVRRISPLAFGIYLLQLNMILWKYVLKGSAAYIAAKPLAVGLIYVLLSSFALFAAGLAVEYLRSRVANKLKIHVLSLRIVEGCQKLLSKLALAFR